MKVSPVQGSQLPQSQATGLGRLTAVAGGPLGLSGLPLVWDLSQGPIQVWIAPLVGAEVGLNPDDTLRALSVWQPHISALMLKPVHVAEQAHVQVHWQPSPLSDRPNMCGHTQLQVSQSSGHIVGASIRIVLNAAIDSRLTLEQRLQRLKATLSHEMGHALGLTHVVDEQSLMHPQQGWRWLNPSKCDSTQCHRLYG